MKYLVKRSESRLIEELRLDTTKDCQIYFKQHFLVANKDDNEGVFKVFKCPRDKGATQGRWPNDREPSLFDTFGNSYFYNSGANSNGPGGLHGKKMAEILALSQVILANDYSFSAYGWRNEVPGRAGIPFQHSYWHSDNQLGWGNVAFLDNHIDYIRATYDQPDYQNGLNWTFLFDGPRTPAPRR